jgi:hypothetical protein
MNDAIPDPHTACWVPIPSSTNKSKLVYVKLSNNSHAPLIWKDAPLSTNHVPLLETEPESGETNNISLWNLFSTSSTYTSNA